MFRVPTGSFQIGSTFWAKPRVMIASYQLELHLCLELSLDYGVSATGRATLPTREQSLLQT